MKKKYKRILLVSVVVISLAAITASLMTPISVAGLRVVPDTYLKVVEEEGALYAQRKWNLFAPQNLIVKKVYVKEGDPVDAGALMIQLDDRLLAKQWAANQNSIDLQLLALKSELAAASAQVAQYSQKIIDETIQGISLQKETLTNQLDSAQKHYENMQILFDEGFISQTELDQAQQAVKTLENSIAGLDTTKTLQTSQMKSSRSYYSSLINSLQKRISALERLAKTGETDTQSAQLAYLAEQTSLYAPYGGKVLSVNVKEEELANPMTPVATVYEEGFVGAEVYLLPSDAALLSPGTKANIIIEGKGEQKQTLSALVTSVSSYAEEIVSKLGLLENRVKVILTLNEPENVIIGQRADIQFVLASKENAIAVPKAAVFEYQDGLAVMTQKDGKAHLTTVKKDFETDTMVVIHSGLSDGDVVLLNPTQEGLKEGARISVDLQ
jgi:HlyD family secretion protein